MSNKKPLTLKRPLTRLFEVLDIAKEDVKGIYIYAAIAGALSLMVPIGIQSIINFAITGIVSTSLVVLILMVTAAVFLTGILQVNQMKLIEKIQQRIFVRYSYEFAYKIPRLNTMKVDDVYLPELVNRFFDTSTLQKSLSKLLLDIPTAMIEIIFSLILLSIYSSVFVFFSIMIVIIMVFILYFTGDKGLKTSFEESDNKYYMAAWIEEIARAYKTFKFGQNSTFPIRITDEIAVKYVNSRTEHFKVLLIQYWSLIGFKIFITIGMLSAGAYLLINNQINVGQFVAAELVILIVLNAVEKVIKSLESVYDLLTSLEKLAKVTDKEIETGGNLVIDESFQGFNIELKDLTFGYKEDNIINQINCNITSGQNVAINGTNGTGKTTLLKLLSLTYPIDKGSLLINSLPISNYNLHSLRARIGVMFSEEDIFSGSLISNIAIGNPNISIYDVMQIADEIKLSPYIGNTNKGLNTILEPMGKGLPASVKQKILLCRALVGKPSLILLDEPFTSFYSTKEKEEFIDYLTTNFKSSTIVVTTNDEYYLSKSDQVINI
jgi:ATP-binding cassette subfamily B protein